MLDAADLRFTMDHVEHLIPAATSPFWATCITAHRNRQKPSALKMSLVGCNFVLWGEYQLSKCSWTFGVVEVSWKNNFWKNTHEANDKWHRGGHGLCLDCTPACLQQRTLWRLPAFHWTSQRSCTGQVIEKPGSQQAHGAATQDHPYPWLTNMLNPYRCWSSMWSASHLQIQTHIQTCLYFFHLWPYP